jgi:PAS domain S-box-containing protein
VRFRLIPPLFLVVTVTAVGFVAARMLAERDARADAGHRADIAATEVEGGIEQATNLVESLRRFLLSRVGADATNARFADVGARWLGPVGLPAAAWLERDPGPAGRLLPAQLVTGADPMTAPGIDLGGEQALVAAVDDPRTLFRVTSTPLVRLRDGQTGLFLVQSAPRLSGGALEPGFVVLFVPASWLVEEVSEETDPRLLVKVGETSYGGVRDAKAVGSAFFATGRRFEVLVPQAPVSGAAAVLPLLVLGGGLVLAVLAGTLAVSAERRTRAQREVDRIFTLSPDPIVVAGGDGYFRRVNPAFERLLGYTATELSAGPILEFIHPDDRERSLAEGEALTPSNPTVGFENRYVCKDGSLRRLEWTITRAPEGVVYAVARDVTERRRSEMEQAALRRVATLAAEGSEPEELFAAVAEEVARIVEVPLVRITRYEPDDTATAVATFAEPRMAIPFGERVSLEGASVLRLVRDTAKAARVDDYSVLEGELAETAQRWGVRSAVGSPIVVAGRLWGAVVAASDERLPEDTDARLADFTELLATAMASAESHQAVERLADEQAALRRVATLVARGVVPEGVFRAVAAEVSTLLGSDISVVSRFEDDATVTVLGAVGWPGAEGARVELEPGYVVNDVRETSRSARFDTDDPLAEEMPPMVRSLGVRSAVASPILVEGELWGTIAAASLDGWLSPSAEQRLTEFTALIGTAIANTQAREQVTTLADEQAALRRVATLVASESSPTGIFQAVTEEAARVLDTEAVGMLRFERDAEAATLVAQSETPWEPPPLGTRFTLEGENLVTELLRTREAARADDWTNATGSVAAMASVLGVRSSVATPIVVEGRLWGTIVAVTSQSEPLPVDTESRLGQFTELVATAIANAESSEARARLIEEQAALRRVATLVAEGVPPAEVFSAVSNEVENLFRLEPDTTDVAAVIRFDPGPEFVLVGVSRNIEGFPVGSRWEPKELYASTRVLLTGQAARVEESELAEAGGDDAEFLRRHGYLSQIASPIVVDGRPWGVITMNTRRPLPPEADQQLTRFTDLVATALANTESREAVSRLAFEQAALRRVATLVARGVRPVEMFSAVTAEVARVVDVPAVSVVRYEADGTATELSCFSEVGPQFPVGSRLSLEGTNVLRLIRESSEAARIDDYSGLEGEIADFVRRSEIRSRVGIPIVAAGRLWGAMVVSATDRLPDGTEARLADFTELLATAIANAESREALERLADEQASLRRMATSVAEGVPPANVFAAVSHEVARLFGFATEGSDVATVVRFDPGPECVLVGQSKAIEGLPLESRWEPKDLFASTRVLRTGRSARVDEHELESGGPDAEALRRQLLLSQVASPIVVEGRLWGSMTMNAEEPLAPDTEERLGNFTELLATAIANAESRGAVQELAEEQAALRRAATLVADEAAPEVIFATVAEEVAGLLEADRCAVGRYESDDSLTMVAYWTTEEQRVPVGTRIELRGDEVTAAVRESGRPLLIDDHEAFSSPLIDYARQLGALPHSTVAAPIFVEGRIWGFIFVSAMSAGFPEGSQSRVMDFTELIATAIANADSRAALVQLSAEQAALRRVATLVAHGASPTDVFSAVAEEVGQLASFDGTRILRYEPDGTATVIAGWSQIQEMPPDLEIGARVPVEGDTLTARVFRTRRPARVDDYAKVEGPLAPSLRTAGVSSAVGAPIVVEGQLWGVMAAGSTQPQPLPPNMESRLAQFTELVATAIANAESRSELTASRARIITAADETRRRIERDLHDGAQQRLVSLGLELRSAEAAIPEHLPEVGERVRKVAGEIDAVIDDLREMSRGIHPAILSEGGLAPALRTLARRAALPVELDIETGSRFPEPVEVAAYYVVSEALTNTAKHADASRARVAVAQRDGTIRLTIDDDGVGGADPLRGTGLIGLRDRVEALGGTIVVNSPTGGGTRLDVELPMNQPWRRSAERSSS